LGKAWGRTPRAWAGGGKTWKELPEGGDKKPGPCEEKNKAEEE